MRNKTFVGMSRSGDLITVTPLYPELIDEELDVVAGVRISMKLSPQDPLAYIVDYNTSNCLILNAAFITEYVEILGEL